MPILGIDASRAVVQEKTGVEWYAWYLIQAMAQCTPDHFKVRCYIPDGKERLKIQNEKWAVQILRWPFRRWWMQGRLSLEMFLHPPEVFFVPSRILPFVHPKRNVTTIHDAEFLAHPELYDPHELWLQRRGLAFALKFAKKIIVPSQATRQELLRSGAQKEQVVVVPHGVDPKFRRAHSESRILVSNYILFIGRLEKKKNVLGLLQAFRQISGEVKLVLAGRLGYGGEAVLQAISTFKLQERVVHLGWVNPREYGPLLQQAAVLVLPSFGEGFGLTILEAMASGVPVACSDLPALRELGGNAVQYFNPYNPEELSRAITSVLGNPMLQAEMIRQGKERAQKYSWEKTAAATWEVITHL